MGPGLGAIPDGKAWLLRALRSWLLLWQLQLAVGMTSKALWRRAHLLLLPARQASEHGMLSGQALLVSLCLGSGWCRPAEHLLRLGFCSYPRLCPYGQQLWHLLLPGHGIWGPCNLERLAWQPPAGGGGCGGGRAPCDSCGHGCSRGRAPQGGAAIP